jgi:propanol-preferring alcohol dehydrogenase
MKCQCMHDFGQPLAPKDRPDPTVSGTEVLIRVEAAGVCHSDLHIRHGGYDLGHGRSLSFKDRGLKMPHVLGHETVGKVVDAGPDAGALDRAASYVVFPWIGCGGCAQCAAGRENLCATPKFLGVMADGGYATHLKAPHPRYLFDIGDIDPSLAAPLACSGLTAFSALKKVEHTLAASPLLIMGAGGLGLMCIGLALAMGGLPPVVVDINPAMRKAAITAGAKAAIDPKAPDAMAQIHAATGGAPTAAIDFVGAEATAGAAFDALGKGGILVMVGLFGGAAPWALPLIPGKAITSIGSYVGNLAEFAELIAFARAGSVRYVPTTTFPLAEADEVLNKLERGEIVGRAILTPAPQERT